MIDNLIYQNKSVKVSFPSFSLNQFDHFKDLETKYHFKFLCKVVQWYIYSLPIN